MTEKNRRVADLTYYPIKSCAGIHAHRVEIGARGILHDRDWLVVENSTNEPITQREYPKMALIKASVSREDEAISSDSSETLQLSAPGMTPLKIDVRQELGTSVLPISVWKADCFALEQGKAASQWLSSYLGGDLRLLRISEQAEHGRAVIPKDNYDGQMSVAFADMFPFLLISTASLEELNGRLDKPIAMNRFRPSIVIDGCEPFEEDKWRSIRIGPIRMLIDSPCARCVLVTIDQETAEKGLEPLKELAKFRKQDGNKTMFGQYGIHLDNGAISCGDEVLIETWKDQ